MFYIDYTPQTSYLLSKERTQITGEKSGHSFGITKVVTFDTQEAAKETSN